MGKPFTSTVRIILILAICALSVTSCKKGAGEDDVKLTLFAIER